MLINSCPICARVFDTSILADILCKDCHTLYAKMGNPTLKETIGLAAQRYLQSRLVSETVKLENSILPSLSTRSLTTYFSKWHSLLDDPIFRELTEKVAAEHELSRASTIQARRFISITLAYEVLVNRTNNFYKIFELYGKSLQRNQETFLPGEEIPRMYLSLVRNKDLQEFEPLYRVIDRYLVKKYGSFEKTRDSLWYRRRQAFNGPLPLTLISTYEVAQILGTSNDVVERLTRAGILTKTHFDDTLRVAYLRSEVEKLNQQWDRAFTLTETSEILPISEKVVKDLINKNLIQGLSGLSIEGTPQWRIGMKNVDESTTELMLTLEMFDNSDPTKRIKIHDASKRVAIKGNLDPFLEAILNRERKVYGKFHINRFYLNLLNFDVNYIDYLFRNVKAENEWVDQKYVAKQMKVKTSVISRWVKNGILRIIASHAGVQYFDYKEVSRFRRNQLSIQQVASELKVGVLTVQNWGCKGRLNPVVNSQADGSQQFLFYRKEVEYWRDHKFLSLSQLARCLNVTRSHIMDWIKEGKIMPISGPNVDNYGRYLFILDSVLLGFIEEFTNFS